ncbi:MAG: hypothetical protein AAF436_20025, partial [Myxococcota bacterium]
MGKLRGFIGLVLDAVDETTNLVERTHDAVIDRTTRRFAPVEPAKSTATVVTSVQRAISGGVFESIRVVNGLVRDGAGLVMDLTEEEFESALAEVSGTLATPLSSEAAGTAGWVIDHAQASINGLWGDYLARRQNGLDLGMNFRVDGRSLQLDPESLRDAIEDPTPKVAVFVHGLASTEWLWSLESEAHYGSPAVTFGSRLRDDYGMTPLYVRYNSGRHISENGQALSELLTELVDAYPVAIEEITLV